MSSLFHRAPLALRPAGPVGIDWDSPLTTGLQDAFIFGSDPAPFNLAQSNIAAAAGTLTPVITERGPALNFNSAAVQTRPPAIYTGGFTALVVAVPTILDANPRSLVHRRNTSTLGAGGTDGSNSSGVWQFVQSNGTLSAALWRSNNTSAGTVAGEEATLTAGKPFVAAVSARGTGSDISLFQDGRKIGSGTQTGPIHDSQGFWTEFGGRTGNQNTRYWGGQLLLGLHWYRGLTDEDLAELTTNPWQVLAPLLLEVPPPLPMYLGAPASVEHSFVWHDQPVEAVPPDWNSRIGQGLESLWHAPSLTLFTRSRGVLRQNITGSFGGSLTQQVGPSGVSPVVPITFGGPVTFSSFGDGGIPGYSYACIIDVLRVDQVFARKSLLGDGSNAVSSPTTGTNTVMSVSGSGTALTIEVWTGGGFGGQIASGQITQPGTYVVGFSARQGGTITLFIGGQAVSSAAAGTYNRADIAVVEYNGSGDLTISANGTILRAGAAMWRRDLTQVEHAEVAQNFWALHAPLTVEAPGAIPAFSGLKASVTHEVPWLTLPLDDEPLAAQVRAFAPLALFRPALGARNLISRAPEFVRSGTVSDNYIVNEQGPAAQFGDVNGTNFYNFADVGTDTRQSATFVWVGQFFSDNGTVVRDSTVAAGYVPIARNGTGFFLRWSGTTFANVGSWSVGQTICFALTVESDGTTVTLRRFANGVLLATDTMLVSSLGAISTPWALHKNGALGQGGSLSTNLLAQFDKPFSPSLALAVTSNPALLFTPRSLEVAGYLAPPVSAPAPVLSQALVTQVAYTGVRPRVTVAGPAAGTLYAVIYPDGEPTPEAIDVVTGYLGVSVWNSSTPAPTLAGIFEWPTTAVGLTPGGVYRVAFAWSDGATESNVASSARFETMAAIVVPALSSPIVFGVTTNSAGLRVTFG